MVKINKRLLPIKIHWFFFMASMGPIFPQLTVYGRQIGVSPDVMGLITSILPFLYVIAKPCVGFLADSFPRFRKLIFLGLLLFTSVFYGMFFFISDDRQRSSSMINSTLLNTSDSSNNSLSTNETISDVVVSEFSYNSATFFMFLFGLCLGTIGYNVTNSISDAICFDILGEDNTMKYGYQRAWGTVGYGVTALISGLVVTHFTEGAVKSIRPAIVVMLIFCLCDILSATQLRLPNLSNSGTVFSDVIKLLKQTEILVFLSFAIIAGIFDCFIFYFMFWHLEDVAAKTGYSEQIKMIEGFAVAAGSIGGEILFFFISGKILRKIGFVHCLSLCFFIYSVRLGLISMITNPWFLIPSEFIFQGVYALCYTSIVAYASAVSPPGTSATIQGLVAGMDDGVGFAIGSLIGGQMFLRLGGKTSFQCLSGFAFVVGIAHIILRPAQKHHTPVKKIKNGYVEPTEQAIEIKTSQEMKPLNKSEKLIAEENGLT